MEASKSEVVYDDLRRRIIDGEFTAGYRLVLSRLAEHYQVSAVPVREALRRLEAEGLLRYTRNVGAEVVGVNQADYAQTMEVLAYLEGIATSLGAAAMTPARLAEARRLNDEMRQVREQREPVRFTELNRRFHEILCRACANDHLVDLLEREWERMGQIRRSSFTLVPERPTASVEEHERLLQLIESGAPADEIERLAREHKRRTMSQFLEAQAKTA